MDDATNPGQPRQLHRVKLDLTINVPTIISMLSITVGAIIFGVRTYNELDKRLTTAEFQQKQDGIRNDKIETQLQLQRAESEARMSSLRGEIKSDLGEIKSTLSTIVMGGYRARREE